MQLNSRLPARTTLHRCIGTMMGMVIAAAPLLPMRAYAEDPSVVAALRAEIKAMQEQNDRQIQALQEQNRKIQQQLDALSAKQNTGLAQTPAQVPALAVKPGSTVVTSPGKGKLAVGDTTIQLGGFLEGTVSNRDPADGTDTYSAFTKVPFRGGSTASSVQSGALNARHSDLRFSARATRFDVGVISEGIPDTRLEALLEGDFLGTGTTSNQNASNSYPPRLRQAWVGYTRTDMGLHVYAGQQFSLLTLLAHGLSPGNEKTPPIIDYANHVGTVANLRQSSVRFVKDIGDNYHLGLALENAQLTTMGTIPPGVVSSFTANSTLGSSTSSDSRPDIIAKVAADTAYGHYELFGLARSLYARRDVTATSAGQAQNKFGGGLGAGAFLPLLPKRLDLEANILSGHGVGRYSAAYFGDAGFTPDGELKTLRNLVAQVSLIGHVAPRLDIYGVAGFESAHGANGTYVADYLPGSNNAGCYAITGMACSAIVNSVTEYTLGAWYTVYRGGAGTMQAGVQLSHLRNDTLKDANGLSPHADQNFEMFSLRYFPFK